MSNGKLRLVIPKGMIQKEVVALLQEVGIGLSISERSYRPICSHTGIEAKLLKPQNIAKLIEIGAHDIAFTGRDWIRETGADVDVMLDTGFNPVRLVVAATPRFPDLTSITQQRVIVASEYELISRQFLEENGIDYIFLRTYGATEVFPPDDADVIIDNTATGRTLQDNDLHIVAEIMRSSTVFIANKTVLRNREQRTLIDDLVTLMKGVLLARQKSVLEMNVTKDRLADLLAVLPAMVSPTISELVAEKGYAVRVGIEKGRVNELLTELKRCGATDILEFALKKVVP